MRNDIQLLRGVAVLAVVFYHSNLGILSHGYLGVDLFFVLSGFLITSVILKGLDNKTFSFSEFYLRRAKRLLPALYSTLIGTTILSVFVLTNQQWLEYLEQLKGALTFTANMVIPTQVGYFESAAEGKPLLHIWSLSLEEQYYFILPITLFLLPKNYRLMGIIILTVISLYWSFSWIYSSEQATPFFWRIADSPKSEWAYFLLFTRAWELLAGSLCAWLVLNKPMFTIPRKYKYIALFLIVLTFIFNVNNEHPSIEAATVVIATMIILLGNQRWLPTNHFTHWLEKIGDWSYSIYLVHWPLFALAYLGYVGDIPNSIKMLIIFASLFFGYLQFIYVETPFRAGKYKNIFANWKVIISTTLILLALPVAATFINSDDESEFSHVRRINHGLSKDCQSSFDKENKLKSTCQQEGKTKIVVWGDSYAMHLIPGLSNKNKGLTQITKSFCGPIINLAPTTEKYDIFWAKNCLKFNESAFSYIRNTPSITHVVVSTNFNNYLKISNVEYLTNQGIHPPNYNQFIDAFKNTILSIKKLGVTPIIFSPLPKTGFNVGECLERMHSSILLLRKNCKIKYEDYQQHQNMVNKALTELDKIAHVVWLEKYLCEGSSCKTTIDGKFVYRDAGHLSIDGSYELLKSINITEL